MSHSFKTQLLVLGGGPGGYAAAFRAADLGLEVTLVERHQQLGGVCLNVGCIPSKALLHVAQVIHEAQEAEAIGLRFTPPNMDLVQIRQFKQQVVNKLTQGIAGMAKGRKIRVVQGHGEFTSAHQLRVKTAEGESLVDFDYAIIAAGSSSVKLPFMPQDARIWDSTRALELNEIPARLLIIGGGIIGLEMATVYQALGSQVTIAEFAEQLIPAADKDLVSVYTRYNKDRFKLLLSTRVETVVPQESGLQVGFSDARDGSPKAAQEFDAILVAVGRIPNGQLVGADKAGVEIDQRGFIAVNPLQQTNVSHIFAVGDIVGQPMLAHKASHQGHVAAEVIAGHTREFNPRIIPSIAYTNPEIAWTGLTEKEAKQQGIDIKTATYPWTANGRALGANRSEGKTKLIYHAHTEQLLGAGIVGINAGELLGELSLAIELGANVEDLALTIHAHPTLHESIGLAGELAAGTITDLPNPASGIHNQSR